MGATIEISIDNTDKVLDEMKDKIQIALEMCGLKAEGYAIQNITRQKAVDTGNLRNSITHQVILNEHGGECQIGTPVEYAPYIEFGTGIHVQGGRRTSWTYKDDKGNWHKTNGMKPRPYLKPAVADHIEEYRDIIENVLKSE